MSKDNYKVYVHINKINGKRYYGITKQKVEYRWNSGKGYSHNEYFYRAINKHGWDNFEHIVIARGLTEEEAKWLEIELIREWNTTNGEYGYNITLGGEGGNGYKPSEETRKKIGEARKGHEVSEETRKKIGEGNKGKFVSEETRKKIGESHKGYKHTKEARKKMSKTRKGKNNPFYGKNHTEETRKKMSENHANVKGKNHPRATKVYCVELEQYFDTITEASEYVSCHRVTISKVLNGKYKTAGGYHWIYAKDVENSKVS